MGASVCALALAGGGAAAMAALSQGPPAAAEQQLEVATAEVELGTLSGAKTISGVLDFAASRELRATAGGILTQLPTPGGTIGNGGELYRIDNRPAFLFIGSLPAWRSFERGMDDGPDVVQLESALVALGYLDEDADGEFDWATESAVEAWQDATGQEDTGRIDFGVVVFSPTELRVGELKAGLGDAVGGGTELFRVSDLAQQVTVDVKLGDQDLAVLGAPVSIRLPGREATTGTIVRVGQPEEREVNGGTQVVIPIVVALDDPVAAAGLQRANVTVDLPSQVRENVLSVPVDALLALPGGAFGVEVVGDDGTIVPVPVETGLFAGGRVEIAGDGVEAGMRVVVPSR